MPWQADLGGVLGILQIKKRRDVEEATVVGVWGGKKQRMERDKGTKLHIRWGRKAMPGEGF